MTACTRLLLGAWLASCASAQTAPLSCDFDNTTACAWTQDGAKKWARGTSTPSSGTGTEQAQSGRHFMFLEASGGRTNDVSYLLLPTFPNTTKSIHFYYHMYGQTMGTLSVEALINNQWSSTGWSQTGQQHSTGSAPWTMAHVNLAASATRIRFKGVKGSSFTGDMAIDTVTFSPAVYVAPVCTCAHGKAATGSSCATNNTEVCASCDAGYVLSSSTP
eukprot:COSAG01_NODE_14810_length_1407_cov_1.334098_1_plen_217_part_10